MVLPFPRPLFVESQPGMPLHEGTCMGPRIGEKKNGRHLDMPLHVSGPNVNASGRRPPPCFTVLVDLCSALPPSLSLAVCSMHPPHAFGVPFEAVRCRLSSTRRLVLMSTHFFFFSTSRLEFPSAPLPEFPSSPLDKIPSPPGPGDDSDDPDDGGLRT